MESKWRKIIIYIAAILAMALLGRVIVPILGSFPAPNAGAQVSPLEPQKRWKGAVLSESGDCTGSNGLFCFSSGTVRYFIYEMSTLYGVEPSISLFIAERESQFAWEGNRYNPKITGDGGDSRGLWQISKRWHPEVSDEVAFDVVSSTIWSMEQMRAGKLSQWSVWKFRDKR